MKIIHCSDIHLDSKMETNLPFATAQERNNEICGTFVRMVEYAVEHDVQVILIAGDLFDTERITSKTAGYLLSVIEKNKKIDFLYLKGNHDEARQAFLGLTLPSNLKTFSNEWTYYQYDFVKIAGVELDNDNAFDVYQTLTLDKNETNIVLMHGQESTQCGADLVCLPKLRSRGINYLALGHLHSYKSDKLDLDGDYCYCGCLEGRGFDECGEKGFVLLDVDRDRVSSSFVPFAKRKLYDIPVDITGLITVSEIRQAMEQAAKDISAAHLVKFTLCGSYTTDTQKDLRFLSQNLNAKYYFVKIKDESRLKIERSSYEHDISLKGAFIRMVMDSDKSDEDKEKIICWGIQALSGEEIVLCDS